MKGVSPTPPLGHSGVASTREAAGQSTMLAGRTDKDLLQFRDLGAKAGTDKPDRPAIFVRRSFS